MNGDPLNPKDKNYYELEYPMFSPNIQSCSILNGPISFCCSIRFGIGLVQIYSSTLVHYSGFSFTHFITEPLQHIESDKKDRKSALHVSGKHN